MKTRGSRSAATRRHRDDTTAWPAPAQRKAFDAAVEWAAFGQRMGSNDPISVSAVEVAAA
jgi:hypothetical protein